MSGQAKSPNKRNQPAKKITIKEFQWYEVETKVRELLTQLLQPFTKKQTQQSVKINEIKRNIGTITQKLEDHDFLLDRENAEKPKYLELQDKKIQDLENKIIETSQGQDHRIREMQKVIQIYEQKIKQVNDIQGRIEQESSERIKSNQVHQNHVSKQIQSMLKRLQNQDTQISNLRSSTRNTVTKLETKSVVVDNRINELEDQMKRKDKQIIKINQILSNFRQKLSSHHVMIQDLTIRISDRQKDQKLSQKFFGKAIQLSNELMFLRNYLTLYQPLYNQIQISETLNSFVKGTMKTRLCVYQQKAFAKMHHRILNTQGDSLETQMGEFGKRIHRIINRNKKYIIKLKIEHTVKYGTNVYELREIDEGMLQADEDNASKPPQVIIPEEQITALMEQKWQKFAKDMEKRVKQQTQPMKIWVNELQEQQLMRNIDISNKIDEMKKGLSNQQAVITLNQTDLLNLQKQYGTKMQNLQLKVNKSKEQIKDLTNFSSVINHIVIQDEIDRQGLALYALRSTKNNNDNNSSMMPNIRLDQKCMSCQDTNTSVIVNQAFKMACLAYNPSQIKIDEKVFSREEILEISTSILQRLKKKLDQKIQTTVAPQTSRNASNNSQNKRRSKSTLSKQAYTQALKPQAFKTINTTTYGKDLSVLPSLSVTRKRNSGEKASNLSVFY